MEWISIKKRKCSLVKFLFPFFFFEGRGGGLQKSMRSLKHLMSQWSACPLDTGTCGNHTIHGSLKNAGKASEWDIGKVLCLCLKANGFSCNKGKFGKKSQSDEEIIIKKRVCLSIAILWSWVVWERKLFALLLKCGQHSVHLWTF